MVREPPELVIFDCDGVLVDSERIAVKVDQVVLATVGIALTEAEIIDRFVGRSASVMDQAIEKQLGGPIPKDLRQRWEDLYRRAFEIDLKPVDGINEALAELRQPACVASSSEPRSLRHKLALTGLLPRFEGRIFSASQVRRGKPAPDVFLYAAAQLGVPPEGCVVVEDSQYGVEAALAADMHVLAYAGGITRIDTLQREGVAVFHAMRDLPGLISQ
jgi:HAD superfamily hydrolase (TIGR01509 family)